MLSPKAQRIFRKWEGDAGMDWSKAAPANLPESPDSAEAFAPTGGGGGGVQEAGKTSFKPGGTYNYDRNTGRFTPQ
jgi:hypothetical protein